MWPLLLTVLLIEVRAGEHQGEIVGGNIAHPHSKPWMALLSREDNTLSKKPPVPICGGFLVHERYAMTAAHCSSTFHNIRVVLGVQNWEKPEPSWQIFDTVAHSFSNYNKRNYENDIVLLKLDRPATLNKYVQLLELPHKDEAIPEGTVCNVAGWGNITLDGNPSPDLREVNVTVLSNEHCQKDLELNDIIIKTRLCAGVKGGVKGKDKDASLLDSGGALVCNGVAEGIVSVGTPKSPPGFYTRICKYMKWYQSILNRAG
ncbi:mast cell protease 1A-like [Ambystoma mexicanum]|uniref:mast cell protease 1A-like n=1 Tax=Ambystoma mexicanum TaxID=8296 RepID=UPI0037E8EDE9